MASSGGCYDWVTFKQTSVVWFARKEQGLPSEEYFSPLPVKQWCRQRIQPKHMVRSKDQKWTSNEGFCVQFGLSPTEASDEEGYGHAWESDDKSSSQSLDDSLTPAAGRSCTRTHTASMVAPSWNLANHLTHMVLGLGHTHATIEGVRLIASLVSWHITPFIQPRSWNWTSPHMFRGGLTCHRSNEHSKLSSCWFTCWVQFFHRSLQYPSYGIKIW